VDAVPSEILSRAKALYDHRAGDARPGATAIEHIAIVWE
jgi:hypothetical protein